MTKKVKKMINKICIVFTGCLLLFFSSCKQPEGFLEPEDPLDAGREFVRAVLDGDFEKASLYVCENDEDKEKIGRAHV